MILQLSKIALVPIGMSVFFYLLEKKTSFRNSSYWMRQIVIGLFFGVAAIMGTEFGVNVSGATINARDAAPLCAGLFFGGPAGIIAGLIGGIERWFAVYWGAGTFSRLACSVATFAAGLLAAFLRQYMFEGKRPKWMMGLATGAIMEIIHLTLLFVLRLNESTKAFNVVKAALVPMVLVNAFAVMIPIVIFDVVEHNKDALVIQNKKIGDRVQLSMLILFVIGFVFTFNAVQKIQTGFAEEQAEEKLRIAIEDVMQDVSDASDDSLLDITKEITLLCTPDTTSEELDIMATQYNVPEIDIINRQGVISASTNRDVIGYAMNSSDQSNEFNILLGSKNSLVQSYQPIGFDSTISRKYAGYKLIGGGYVQVGLDEAAVERFISNNLTGVSEHRHIGQNGYLMVCDYTGKIISDPNRRVGYNIKNLGFNIKDNNIDEWSMFNFTIDNTDCECMYGVSEGYFIIGVVPDSEVYLSNEMNLLVSFFMEVILFFLLFVMTYSMTKNLVVDKLILVGKGLNRIAAGDLDESVEVRNSAEFNQLSDDINRTVDTLKNYITEAEERIASELKFAKDIQASALPNIFPAYPNRKDFDIYAFMATAKEVGGDFYDFYLTHHDTFNFMIADVSGKGIPAALFMMRAKTQLKSLTESGHPIDEVFTLGNNGLCEGNDAEMFVTGWQGRLDLTSGHVDFANAGHNPPLVRHAGGQFEYLKSRAGMVLAGMEGVRYKKQELELSRGDIIFLYTDGVTEATNADNELYGEDRLQNFLNSVEFANMDELCHKVKEDVDAFVAEAPQFDDITMVALEYKGHPDKPTYHSDKAAIDDIPGLTEFIEAELEKRECPMKAVMQIDIAIDEIYSNIANYAYLGREQGFATVVLSDTDDETGIELTFIDEGKPYNPLMKEDPDVTLSAEERPIGGLGIYMVKKSMNDIRYEYVNGLNKLTLVKYFKEA